MTKKSKPLSIIQIILLLVVTVFVTIILPFLFILVADVFFVIISVVQGGIFKGWLSRKL